MLDFLVDSYIVVWILVRLLLSERVTIIAGLVALSIALDLDLDLEKWEAIIVSSRYYLDSLL